MSTRPSAQALQRVVLRVLHQPHTPPVRYIHRGWRQCSVEKPEEVVAAAEELFAKPLDLGWQGAEVEPRNGRCVQAGRRRCLLGPRADADEEGDDNAQGRHVLLLGAGGAGAAELRSGGAPRSGGARRSARRRSRRRSRSRLSLEKFSLEGKAFPADKMRQTYVLLSQCAPEESRLG